MSMCDRIALMNEGRIEQIATPTDIYDQPKNRFVASFIGSPPIAFYTGTVHGHRFEGKALAFELPHCLGDMSGKNGRMLTVGIRPEALQPDLPIPVDGTIAFVEPQGRETLYRLRLSDDQLLRSVQSGGQCFKRGERVHWGLDPNSLLFFDEDGDSL